MGATVQSVEDGEGSVTKPCYTLNFRQHPVQASASERNKEAGGKRRMVKVLILYRG